MIFLHGSMMPRLETRWPEAACYPKARYGVWRKSDAFAYAGVVAGHSLGGKLALACCARAVVCNANPFLWEVNTKQVWLQVGSRDQLVSVRQMERLAAKLVNCGCDVQLHVVNGAPHRWLWELNNELLQWISQQK